MKNLFTYLKAHPKLAVFFAAFLFAAVLGVGWEIRLIVRGLAQMDEPVDAIQASTLAPVQLHPASALRIRRSTN